MLGLTQILAFGTSLYLLGVLADFILADVGWSRAQLSFGFTLGVLVAALVSPRLGRAIHAGRGFRVLAASPFLFASGLGLMSIAGSYPFYLLAWALIGGGMASGLYDTVFAILGHKYGLKARFLITTVAVLGAFASTTFWPASAYLVGLLGWRGALQCFALAHLVLSFPLIYFFAPRPLAPEPGQARSPKAGERPKVELHGPLRLSFYLLATILSIEALIAGTFAIHLVAILQALGASLSAAVAATSLIGPSQVFARLTDVALGRFASAMSTLALSVGFLCAGIVLLSYFHTGLWLPMIVSGLGIGMSTIARGAVPLTLFPVEGYAAIVGRMARPIHLTQALAPYLAALIAAEGGLLRILSVLGVFSVLNLALVVVLARVAPKAADTAAAT